MCKDNAMHVVQFNAQGVSLVQITKKYTKYKSKGKKQKQKQNVRDGKAAELQNIIYYA